MAFCLVRRKRQFDDADEKGMSGTSLMAFNNGSLSAHVPRPNSAPYSAALDGRKYDIAVGQIDIGNAGTEMTARMKDGVPQANGETATEPTMDVDHVARAVLYMASLPPDANVLFLTVMATRMPFVGRG